MMPESSPKTLFIASDHGGYSLKEFLKENLTAGFATIDLGTASEASVDYPRFAHALADRVAADPDTRGILICGTGIGMSITANRHRNIRAALVHDNFTAQMAKEHNNANILVLGGRVLEPSVALELVKIWLNARFEGGRHQQRLDLIDKCSEQQGRNVAAPLSQVDPEISRLIMQETEREESKLIMIASENCVSQAVLDAQGSVLTNKYAEGYPGKRYYGGCQFVDQAEQLAIDRALALFGADHANVQPLSGSGANMAVYLSVLQPGDKILGMNLAHGGHLTHGATVSFSGQLYRSTFYGVDRKTERLDYDVIEDIALRERPRMIVAGASSYSRTLDFPRFRAIADKVGALLMVDIAHIAGLVVSEAHPSPVPYADFVTTTTHKTLRGPRGGMILCRREFAKKINQTIFPGIQGGPLMHIIAAKAVAFKEAMSEEFKNVQKQTVLNAAYLADRLQEKGLRIVSGGTDNHLFLIDLTNLPVNGKRAEEALDNAGITANKNGIPFDPRNPADPSGIRIGTPIASTRGMRETEMKIVADCIAAVLQNPEDETVSKQVRSTIRELCTQFPVYSHLL
ncbi:MAG: ribose 5-phosphate isomerase B [Deltaproteobacteria bacterium]|nr:ribose 5-phosphate isomerase B [Deltaproteobacteria bacterium]